MSLDLGLDSILEGGDLMLEPLRAQAAREFEGLQAFALHLTTLELAWRAQRAAALNAAAKIIKQDCRAQIGHYQDGVGNYPEWAPLADSTEEEKARLGAPPDAPLERFGDLKKSFRSTLDKDGEEVIVGSTDPVMEYHEFGTVKMPPRPVLGPALLKNIDKIRQLLGVAIVDTVVVGQRLGYRFNAPAGGIAQPEDD